MKKSILFSALILASSISFADEAPVVDESHAWQMASSTAGVPVVERPDAAERAPDPSLQDNSPMDERDVLLSKMSALEQEITSLRGELEVQAREISKLKQRPVAVVKPKKIKALSMALTPVVAPIKNSAVVVESEKVAVNKVSEAPRAINEKESYHSAFELVKNRHYDDAMPALKNFLSRFPKGEYSANAHYWLGELYLLKRQYQQAFQSFDTIVSDFPESNKVPSARYKLGVTYGFLGKRSRAHTEFLQVTEKYPNTAVARLAQAKLSEY